MLQQFTWQDFLIAAVVLSLVWYVRLLLLSYLEKKRVKAFVGDTSKVSEPLPHRWENGVDALDDDPSELMGKAKMPDGMATVSMGSLAFVQDERAKEDQVGLVPDVLEEIKAVFATLATTDGNKRDFFSLMEEVRDRYPRISSSPHLAQINGFISGHAPFHLTTEELENLWD